MPGVEEYLRERGVPFEAIPHAQAYTSIGEARSLGISADEVLKCILVKAASGYALAVVPGGRRLDMKRVRDAVADPHAQLATEEEMEQHFPDFDLGTLPPLGGLLGVPVYVDPEITEHETVVFAAGSQTESVKVRSEQFFQNESVSVTPLYKRPEEMGRDSVT
jgi:Ala-tRNA(Pro) deacylase